MTFCELALVLLIAVLVLGPKELKACAFGLAKVWRTLQSTKALISAQLLNADVKPPKPPHD